MRIAYLFSRYPIVSQTFCDTEILALEKMGVELEIYSIYPPPTSFRHGHAARIQAEIHYAPPASILKAGEAAAREAKRWPVALIAEHDRKYGVKYKAELRARNALYFADLFRRRGITHFHVHFANRAAHTAIFIKALSGLPFSVSTHGQDFMSDLGDDDLLREICAEAVFVANETEYSKGLLLEKCPESAAKMARVFNGMDLTNFPEPPPLPVRDEPQIVSVGRLIEFKGFHHLIPACARLRDAGRRFRCDIIGEGPWRERLTAQIAEHQLEDRVQLHGSLPQEQVFERLRGCDIFTLACTFDSKGASDVFPTVILEAMASAKPVVSTRVAGVPEQIVPEETGLLVDHANVEALAEVLGRVIDSADLRRQLGNAGRERLFREFAIEQTVLPLHALFEEHVRPAAPAPDTRCSTGCLLESWPAKAPLLLEYCYFASPSTAAAFYCSGAGEIRTPPLPEERVSFLPDGMVIEGEWTQHRELGWRIETWRSDLGQKLSSELYLQQARIALFLRGWVERDGVRHIHAMGPRELLCGWILKRLCGVKLTAHLSEPSDLIPSSILADLAVECDAIAITGKNFKERAERLSKHPAAYAAKQWKSLDQAYFAALSAGTKE